MIDKALIADLVRAGVDADLVARIIAALVDSLSTNVDSRHRVDRREYQRQWAANKRGKSTSSEANDAEDVAPVSTNVDSLSTVDTVDNRCNFLSSSSFLTPLPEKKKKKEVVARARGTRLSADWQLTDELRQFAVEHNQDPATARNEFVDYWIGVPGARGTKLDWPATFRNRVRENSRRQRPNGHAPRSWKDERQEENYRVSKQLREYVRSSSHDAGESGRTSDAPPWKLPLPKPS